MTASPMRTKIDFPVNVGVCLALAFAEGKPVASRYGAPEVMFSTTDNRCFFLSDAAAASLAQQVREKGIRAKDPVVVTKSQTPGDGKPVTRWLIDKTSTSADSSGARSPIGRQPDGTFAVPKINPGANQEQSDMARLVQAEVDKRLGKWQPKPIGSAGMHEPPPAAAPVPASGSNPGRTDDGGHLVAALKMAVTAAHQATLHAKAIGYQIPAFTGEDLRTMANTMVIQGGGR
jgi:hypothetical protein